MNGKTFTRRSLLILLGLAIVLLSSFAAYAGGMPEGAIRMQVVLFQQSVDSGDAFSATLLVVADPSDRNTTMAVFTEPGLSMPVNVEHPLGAEGLIVGVLIFFDTEMNTQDALAAAQNYLDSQPAFEGAYRWYVGKEITAGWNATSLPFWVTSTPDCSAIGEPVYVKGWDAEDQTVTLPLEGGQTLGSLQSAPADTLYQLWDGVDGNVADHIVIPMGAPQFTLPSTVERQGTGYLVTVALEDRDDLMSRFAQMSEEVRCRDQNPDNPPMQVNRLWAGDLADMPVGYVDAYAFYGLTRPTSG